MLDNLNHNNIYYHIYLIYHKDMKNLMILLLLIGLLLILRILLLEILDA